jgi:thioredoxin-like negative regulator of GroEL
MEKEELNRQIQEAIPQKPCVLFFKSNACSPCEDLALKLKKVIQPIEGLTFFEIQSEEHPDICAAFEVYSAPVIICYFDGKEYIREGIYTSVQQLKGRIEKYLDLMKD